MLQNVSVVSKCPDETAHVQDDVNPHILRILEGIFSLDAALILGMIVCQVCYVRALFMSVFVYGERAYVGAV